MAKNSISPYIKMEDISNKIMSHKEKGELNDSICLFYFMFASKLVAPMHEKNQFLRVADTILIATNKVIEKHFGLSRRKREEAIKTLEKLNFIKIHTTEGGANAYEFLVGVYFGQKEKSKGIPADFRIQFGHHELSYPSDNEETGFSEVQEEPKTEHPSPEHSEIVITPVEQLKPGNVQGVCTDSPSKAAGDHARVYNSYSFNTETSPTQYGGGGSKKLKFSKKKIQLAKEFVDLKIQLGEEPKKTKQAWVSFKCKQYEETECWEYIHEEIDQLKNQVKMKKDKENQDEILRKNKQLEEDLVNQATEKLNTLDEFDEEYHRIRSQAISQFQENAFLRQRLAEAERSTDENSRKNFEKLVRGQMHGIILAKIKQDAPELQVVAA